MVGSIAKEVSAKPSLSPVPSHDMSKLERFGIPAPVPIGLSGAIIFISIRSAVVGKCRRSLAFGKIPFPCQADWDPRDSLADCGWA